MAAARRGNSGECRLCAVTVMSAHGAKLALRFAVVAGVVTEAPTCHSSRWEGRRPWGSQLWERTAASMFSKPARRRSGARRGIVVQRRPSAHALGRRAAARDFEARRNERAGDLPIDDDELQASPVLQNVRLWYPPMPRYTGTIPSRTTPAALSIHPERSRDHALFTSDYFFIVFNSPRSIRTTIRRFR